MADPETFAGMVAARAADDRPGLRFEGRAWTWREVIEEAARRADLATSLRRAGPWHIGVLLDNTPENLFWILGSAVSGATVVGINPTRRGSELARDINFTDCQLLVTDAAGAELLDGLELDCPPERIIRVDRQRPTVSADGRPAQTPDAIAAGADRVDPATILTLVFTSGTTGGPKAVICSQRRMAEIAAGQRDRRGLTASDVFYLAMPLFHSNALMAGIAPAVLTGGCLVLRRKFSASGFLPDVRANGVTFFNYVGKPLHYILSTPELPDDADNPLRIAFGNEATDHDIAEFARRFGCQVLDSYGTSEGGMRINRVPDAPPGSLGVADEGTVVMNPQTLIECPAARFDTDGRILNAEEATGEIVNLINARQFEGYYRNPQADAQRIRNGWFWSGDLAYRDLDGYWFFAGRTDDWLRVDGENFAAAPIERLLLRHPVVSLVAVYAIPDPVVGDQVMAAVELVPGATLDADGFGDFLSAQTDLGTKWAPRYLRVVAALPRTPTNKVVKRPLRADGIDTDDPLYIRDGNELRYRLAAPATAGEAMADDATGGSR
ncbi:AMP-binding protein [Nakamurella lactea]|uniref:AMP-binding protein n=1 Tax=Nakamurella lactea TaxID=459515 RepID=UPI00042A811C|nr:AMP-binding protein [Nakamurella lactea]